ncbi:bis-aminopropyl spermidine synthase family protein [Methanotorris igneus]|uniref:N(4)-bis(aminopropyl)spermidine synthase C-terminal domain-containing protein n=1 Tax=Methanotorris igneus (strain DSM 5666 / JCM 11834 / Kol 5) TaxID=880724 RepID=F6BD41_METIK|nr:bis-aminopropyl spermidine synthase family protein [Methanotorris igneus]AEF96402.1 protein of unknown function DUF43 [Methanotorris igneus Kol 5]
MKIIGKIGKGKKEVEEKDVIKPILLKEVARKADIAEGERAVEDILRCIYRNQPISTKKIGQYVKLPLPIVAKVRTLLERAKILDREEKGAVLTEIGKEFVEKELKLKMKHDLTCPLCNGKGIVLDEMFEEILKKQKEYAKKRPIANTTIDQSYATPETAIYRAALMAQRGDLEGKRVLFVGDDDLTSIPTALTNLCEEVVVVDIDERLLKLIDDVSKKENLNIKTIKHDLRNPLPEKLKNKFDVIFTDPPYTLNGMKLFLSRGIEGLGDEGVAYLAFSHKPIDEWIEVQKTLSEMGFVIYELIPGFNLYEGSEIIGNTTFLARLIGKNLKPIIGDTEKIYTGEVKPTLRYYKCLKCGKIHEVGDKIKRVEDLICECGGQKFSMVKRKKIKN